MTKTQNTNQRRDRIEIEDHEDLGPIIHCPDLSGEDHIYRVIEGDAVEVWEHPEPEIGHFGRWIPATEGDGDDVPFILAAFHQWTGNVHA